MDSAIGKQGVMNGKMAKIVRCRETTSGEKFRQNKRKSGLFLPHAGAVQKKQTAMGETMRER